MQSIVLHFCYFVLILLFSTAYNTSLIYCFLYGVSILTREDPAPLRSRAIRRLVLIGALKRGFYNANIGIFICLIGNWLLAPCFIWGGYTFGNHNRNIDRDTWGCNSSEQSGCVTMIREIISQKCGDCGGFLPISGLSYTMVIDISCPLITPATQVPCYTSVLPWINPRGERMLNSGRRSPIARQVHKACTFGGALFKKRIVIPMFWLVGGLDHFLFSISYMGCHPSHWLIDEVIFFGGVETTNQLTRSTRSCGSHDTNCMEPNVLLNLSNTT